MQEAQWLLVVIFVDVIFAKPNGPQKKKVQIWAGSPMTFGRDVSDLIFANQLARETIISTKNSENAIIKISAWSPMYTQTKNKIIFLDIWTADSMLFL